MTGAQRGDAAFFLPEASDRFRSTAWTRGPWDPGFQHGGPPAALLGRALERCAPRPDFALARVTCEILSPVPLAPLEVRARVARPGRNVELLEGALRAAGKDVVRARAWRLATSSLPADAAITGGGAIPDTDTFDPPGTAEPFFPTGQDTGYHTAMEWSFEQGSFLAPGPARVWLRTRLSLVAGEEPSPLVRVLLAADSGNGVSTELDFRRFLFVNTDLTVALHRPAVGPWVCLDARTTLEPHGVGLTSAVLGDAGGPIGRSLQTLFVRAR